MPTPICSTFSHLSDAATLAPTSKKNERRQCVARGASAGAWNVRRAARWLGAAALATPAAASVDLVQSGGPGRIRISAEPGPGDGFNPWRPMPAMGTKLELMAARAVLAGPPCLAARLADAEHAWPDAQSFSLAFVPGFVEVATSDVSDAALACIASRVGALGSALSRAEGREDEVYILGSAVIFVFLVFACQGGARRSAPPAAAQLPGSGGGPPTAAAAPPTVAAATAEELEGTELEALLPAYHAQADVPPSHDDNDSPYASPPPPAEATR